MNLMRNLKLSFLGVSLVLLSPDLLFGQSEKGAIVGVVTDPTGATVPGATVTITNLGTKTDQSFTTNSEGLYEAPFLIPAVYMVTVKATGFKTAMVNEVILNVGRRESVNVQLETGEISETVVISDTLRPLLQTENASIGTVVTTKQLTDLPSQDRNVYGFLTLDSTVNNGPTGNAEAFRLNSGGSFAISGTRPSSITFKIDGQANNDPTFGTPTVTPTLDTVKEFQLQNNAYSAEFEGITQVNIATKSGTRGLHGSAYEFAQNDFFQPRNPLLAPDKSGKPAKNKLRFNQFGGTIGGPLWLPRFGEGGPAVIKDRTFFFFSYEGKRLSGTATGFARVLTEAERRGDFSSSLGACLRSGTTEIPLLNPNGTPSGQCIRMGQIFDPATTVANPGFNPAQAASALNPQFIRQPFANNQLPSNRINPLVPTLINVQQPLPNRTSTDDLNYLGVSGARLIDNQWSVRIDHRISDRDNIYGRLTWQNNGRDNVAVLPFQNVDVQGKGRVFNFSWSHVLSSSLVNELRLGYVRGVYGQDVEEIDPAGFGISNSRLNTLPGLLVSGSLNFGGFTGSILQTTQNTYQIADNVSWVRGRHAFKFGFKIDENRFKNSDLFNANGRATFNGLFSTGNSSIGILGNRNNFVADFLLGQANSHSLQVPGIANLQNRPWAAYLQDDWKVHSRVTMNFGFRYEYHQPFRENLLGGSRVDFENGGFVTVADPAVAQVANSPLVVCCTDPRVVDPDKNDFGPRIGVAIQPFENDPTVLRAGYGIFYADTSQFFHWTKYTPLRNASFTGAQTSFQTPAISLSNLFPSSQFSTTGGVSVAIPTGVNPAAVNNQPVVNISSLGSYKTPQSQQWSVSLQRELWRDTVLELTYAGNVAKNLPLQWFFNQPTFSPTVANFQSLVPAANPYLRREFSNFTINSNVVANVLSSNYNAGTAKLTKRFSQGYSFTSSYTWSKAIDQGAEVFTVFSNHAFLSNNHDFDANRAVSAFDVPHRWVTNGIVELPFGSGKPFWNSGGWVDKLVGGWRFSGVFSLQSGLPFTPYALSIRTNTGIGSAIVERGDLVGEPYLTGEEWDAAVKAWEQQGLPLFLIRQGAINSNYAQGTGGSLGRNVFRLPYGRSLNLSMAKNTRLGENTRLELRFDMFNVTREVLHRTNLLTLVRGSNTLTTTPGTVGSIAGRNTFFLPHTIQLGVRLTF
jgi:hypothetical protein